MEENYGTRKIVDAKCTRKDGEKYVSDGRVEKPRVTVKVTKKENGEKVLVVKLGLQVKEALKAGEWLNPTIFVPI